jgi:phospholipid transport system substrate-binding protein
VKITVKNLIPIALVTVLLYIPPSVASEITDRVKVNIDEAMRVLNDLSFMGPENTEKRKMSKRSLARHWRKRTEEEKEKFIELFINFLEMSYIDKIERYSDAEVLYAEEKRDKNRAVVKTKVITRQETDIPINYRLLLRKDGEWVAYDVVIEGVSLVSNYRTQFNQIIQNSSYEELIKKLEKRVEEWKQGKLKASEKE